jgi:hypothetical protein
MARSIVREYAHEVLQALDLAVKRNSRLRGFVFRLPIQSRCAIRVELSGPANSSNVCILFASLHYSVNGSVRPTQLATKSAAE